MAITIRRQKKEKVNDISTFLEFKPNNDQAEALNLIKDFIDNSTEKVFVLTGAAGTGKTSIMKAVISYINSYLGDFNLLAPTGRAANIIAQKSNYYAQTIHSHIYSISEIKDNEGRVVKLRFHRKSNMKDYNEVFFVDEASMISDVPSDSGEFVSENSLMHDFMEYVKQGNSRNKIIFIGDTYQLPPVNSSSSHALDAEYITTKYGVGVKTFELKEVMRQANDSYILDNAQKIKNAINHQVLIPELRFANIEESLNKSAMYVEDIKKYGYNKAIALAWTNKTISNINKQVRDRLYPDPSQQVQKGEHLILSEGHFAKNYIPNGTFVEVIDIVSNVTQYADFKFIEVKLRNSDSHEELPGTYQISLDYLSENDIWNDSEKVKKLWNHRYKYNKDLQESKNKKDDEFIAALKVKYAYAITVHKAQGGEWDRVYFHPEQPSGQDGKRLVYTAVTRSKSELIKINRF
jgi:exodeoxyribonuclease-5